MENDVVNHPKHYADGMTVELECNMFKRWLPSDLSDAFKYVWRAGKKDDLKQDIEKALWYLEDALAYGITCNLKHLVPFLPKSLLPEWKYDILRYILYGNVDMAYACLYEKLNELNTAS